MKILYAVSECAPFIKTGGLADVAEGLPPALAEKGVEVAVVMPLYGAIASIWRDKMKLELETTIDLNWRSQYCGVLSLKQGEVTYYFLDNEYYFKREKIYGEYDDGERFAFFSRAAAVLFGESFDVIHCNDWQTALIPLYLKDMGLSAKTVFSIHNIEYQGKFGYDIIENVFGLSDRWRSALEYDGCVNLMKVAIEECSVLTTVSRTYAEEIKNPEAAHGLDPIIRKNAGKLTGIVNGIHVEGVDITKKAVIKLRLQKKLGIKQNRHVPLMAMVSRLVSHKGIGLILDAFNDIMENNIQFVLLGTGDSGFEDAFRALGERYRGRVSINIMYNNALAENIYAAADLYLMPSLSEPCGLSQLIAMKNGAIPIVRLTGGLRDTVLPYNPQTGEGRGFTFLDASANELARAVGRALENKIAWRQIAERNISADFGWSAPAEEYMKIYGGN